MKVYGFPLPAAIALDGWRRGVTDAKRQLISRQVALRCSEMTRYFSGKRYLPTKLSFRHASHN